MLFVSFTAGSISIFATLMIGFFSTWEFVMLGFSRENFQESYYSVLLMTIQGMGWYTYVVLRGITLSRLGKRVHHPDEAEERLLKRIKRISSKHSFDTSSESVAITD